LATSKEACTRRQKQRRAVVVVVVVVVEEYLSWESGLREREKRRRETRHGQGVVMIVVL
jgi:hypothetical protein